MNVRMCAYARVRNRVWMCVCSCVRVHTHVRMILSMHAFMCVHVCAQAHSHIHVYTHKLRHLKYTLACDRSWCMITRLHQGCIQALRCIWSYAKQNHKINISMHACAIECGCMCVPVCVCTCMYARCGQWMHSCVCMYVRMHMYTFMYTHINYGTWNTY